MVLVGNKCDLQAWAVDMAQARDVSCKAIKSFSTSNEIDFRLRSSTACRLSRHLPKREWVSTMHFTRWSAKSARTKRGGRKAKVSELAVTPIAASGVSCYKKRPINPTHVLQTHARIIFYSFNGRWTARIDYFSQCYFLR